MDLYADDAEMHGSQAELNVVKSLLQSDLDDAASPLALQFCVWMLFDADR